MAFGAGFPALLLYTIGIPGFAFWVLYSRRDKLHEPRLPSTLSARALKVEYVLEMYCGVCCSIALPVVSLQA